MAVNWKFWNKGKTSLPQVPYRKSVNTFTTSGVYVTEESSKKVAAFYRGLTYISTQIAKLPLEIKNKKNEEIENKVYFLLNVAPNKEMTAFEFKCHLVQQAIVLGSGYAEIERNILGEPVALHILNSHRVQKMRTPDSEIVYRVSSENGNAETYLPYMDVLELKNFVSSDGQTGQGIVHYAQNTLGISLAADTFASALYANGGMPSGVLEKEGRLSDEAYNRLKEDWKKQHGGKKTGGTAILEEGVKYRPVSFSPDILQFLESRKFGVLEIARFLGLPPTKLFDGDASTYNNIEHSNLEVAIDTLDSWARNFESVIDVKLLSNRRGGLRSEFDMYAVFRGDMTTRANYFKTMMQNAAMNPNEIRQKEGKAPYAGGERYYIATNNFTPLDRMDEVIDSQIKSKEPKPEPKKTEEETELEAMTLDFVKKRLNN